MSIIINNVETLNVTTLNNNTSAPSNVCSKCHHNKPLTDYNKDKRKSDNLRSNCKSCQSNTNKLYWDNNINNNVNKQINSTNIYNENDVKICAKCKQSKSITKYQKNNTKSNGLRSCCKSCRSINTTNYQDNSKQINDNKIFNDNDIEICSKCKQQKLYTEFYKCATKPLGLATCCKQCESNDSKTIFGKRFSYIISSAIKSNNTNCLSFTGCDANF